MYLPNHSPSQHGCQAFCAPFDQVSKIDRAQDGQGLLSTWILLWMGIEAGDICL